MTKPPRTHEEIQRAVLSDHAAFVGRLVEAYEVNAYCEGECIPLRLATPAVFRIDYGLKADLLRWCYQWCDPIWHLTLVKAHPELRRCSGFWVHGPSYELGTGKREPITLRVLSREERLWLALRTLGGLLQPKLSYADS